MLALIKDGAILRSISPGVSEQVEDGLWVSPTAAGWSHDGYSLATVVTQDAPEGSRVGSWDLQLINGVPTNVPTILPPLTDAEKRDAMPEITPRQLRLTLLSVGITEDQVDAALVDNAAGKIEWKYATKYKRTHPLITQLIPTFNLTEEQVDSLWAYAADIA